MDEKEGKEGKAFEPLKWDGLSLIHSLTYTHTHMSLERAIREDIKGCHRPKRGLLWQGNFSRSSSQSQMLS